MPRIVSLIASATEIVCALGLEDQFHPSYTRMVPAHHVVRIELVGCPDPNPTYARFFAPERNALPAGVEDIGTRYVSATQRELARWLAASRRFRTAAFASLEHITGARALLWELGQQLVPDFAGQAKEDAKRELQLVERALRDVELGGGKRPTAGLRALVDRQRVVGLADHVDTPTASRSVSTARSSTSSSRSMSARVRRSVIATSRPSACSG